MTPESTLIEHLKLSPRVYNALINAGVDTVEQLRATDLMPIRGIGKHGRAEIEAALSQFPLQP